MLDRQEFYHLSHSASPTHVSESSSEEAPGIAKPTIRWKGGGMILRWQKLKKCLSTSKVSGGVPDLEPGPLWSTLAWDSGATLPHWYRALM
jgi:hypothetical protein